MHSKYLYPIKCRTCSRQIKDSREHRRGWCRTCFSRLKRSGEIELLPRKPLVDTLTKDELEIITGHLLGDGGLFYYKQHRHKAPHFALGRASHDREYLEWSHEQLHRLTTDHGIIDASIYDKRTEKTYYNSHFNTRANPVYQELHEKWYPQGKKVVPEDLVFTPLMLAIWLADDGNVRKSPTKGCYDDVIMLKLSTEAFPEEDTRRLAQMLHDRYGEYYGVYKNGNGLNIQSSSKATWALVNEIDAYWPEGIGRKAYWRSLSDVPQERKPHANTIKTHCKNGHEFNEENTYVNPTTGHRTCRTCMRTWDIKRREARNSARGQNKSS